METQTGLLLTAAQVDLDTRLDNSFLLSTVILPAIIVLMSKEYIDMSLSPDSKSNCSCSACPRGTPHSYCQSCKLVLCQTCSQVHDESKLFLDHIRGPFLHSHAAKGVRDAGADIKVKMKEYIQELNLEERHMQQVERNFNDLKMEILQMKELLEIARTIYEEMVTFHNECEKRYLDVESESVDVRHNVLLPDYSTSSTVESIEIDKDGITGMAELESLSLDDLDDTHSVIGIRDEFSHFEAGKLNSREKHLLRQSQPSLGGEDEEARNISSSSAESASSEDKVSSVPLSHQLVVKNFHQFSTGTLAAIFSCFGPVKNISPSRHKTHICYVTFPNSELVETAIACKPMISGDGIEIKFNKRSPSVRHKVVVSRISSDTGFASAQDIAVEFSGYGTITASYFTSDKSVVLVFDLIEDAQRVIDFESVCLSSGEMVRVSCVSGQQCLTKTNSCGTASTGHHNENKANVQAYFL